MKRSLNLSSRRLDFAERNRRTELLVKELKADKFADVRAIELVLIN